MTDEEVKLREEKSLVLGHTRGRAEIRDAPAISVHLDLPESSLQPRESPQISPIRQMWQLRLGEFAAILSSGNEENQELKDRTGCQWRLPDSYLEQLQISFKLDSEISLRSKAGKPRREFYLYTNLCGFGPLSPFS